MYLLNLLFNVTGRINRESFLIGFGVYIFAAIVGVALFNPDQIDSQTLTPPRAPLAYFAWNMFWGVFVFTVIVLKRFNDTFLPKFPAFIFGGLGLILVVAGFWTAPAQSLLPPLDQLTWLQWVLVSPVLLFYLVILIVCAAVQSTEGPNEHGPEPTYPKFIPDL